MQKRQKFKIKKKSISLLKNRKMENVENRRKHRVQSTAFEKSKTDSHYSNHAQPIKV